MSRKECGFVYMYKQTTLLFPTGIRLTTAPEGQYAAKIRPLTIGLFLIIYSDYGNHAANGL